MKYLSQDSESVIEYVVWSADWVMSDIGTPDISKIDERTERVRHFASEIEATAFAERILTGNWVAYVEIKKCTYEVIKKLK